MKRQSFVSLSVIFTTLLVAQAANSQTVVTSLTVWRPSDGKWYVLFDPSFGRFRVQQWGVGGDIPAVGDYVGDRSSDFAVWRPSDGFWYILPGGSFLGGSTAQQLGVG